MYRHIFGNTDIQIHIISSSFLDDKIISLEWSELLDQKTWIFKGRWNKLMWKICIKSHVHLQYFISPKVALNKITF